MKDKVCVFLAEGLEEIEGLTAVDILRRSGVDTVMVSVTDSRKVTGSHGIAITADRTFDEMDYGQVTMLVLPGGMPGTDNLDRHDGLSALLGEFHSEGRYIAAICAAPSILGKRGMLSGRKAVSYPSREEELIGAEVLKEEVVQDGHIITSRGMGTATAFSLRLVRILCGMDAARQIEESIIYRK